MTCEVWRCGGGRYSRVIVTLSPFYRLRLPNGGYVFMEWHSYCGPTFFRDKLCKREIGEWWNDPVICAALDWFIKRGKKA